MELLIAVLIFSIIIFTLFASFQAFMKTSETIVRDISQSEKMHLAIKRIHLDFEQLYVLKMPQYSKPEFDSDPDPYRFVSQEVTLDQKNFSSIGFTSLAHVKTGKDLRHGVARISYYIKEKENNTFDLYRGDKLQPYPEELESCADHVLAEDISGFEISFTDVHGDKHRHWDSDSKEFQYTVPAIVSLKLVFNSQGAGQVVETAVRLLAARSPIE